MPWEIFVGRKEGATYGILGRNDPLESALAPHSRLLRHSHAHPPLTRASKGCGGRAFATDLCTPSLYLQLLGKSLAWFPWYPAQP